MKPAYSGATPKRDPERNVVLPAVSRTSKQHKKNSITAPTPEVRAGFISFRSVEDVRIAAGRTAVAARAARYERAE